MSTAVPTTDTTPASTMNTHTPTTGYTKSSSPDDPRGPSTAGVSTSEEEEEAEDGGLGGTETETTEVAGGNTVVGTEMDISGGEGGGGGGETREELKLNKHPLSRLLTIQTLHSYIHCVCRETVVQSPGGMAALVQALLFPRQALDFIQPNYSVHSGVKASQN